MTVASRIGPIWTLRLVAVSLATGAAGCDTLSGLNPFDRAEKYKPEIVEVQPAETMYNQGLARLKANDYPGAAKKFEEIDKAHPYSEWSKKGLVMIAFAHYEGREYADAIAAARRYLTLHPASADAAYAQYIMGMSYFRQVPDVERDQEASELALRTFNELMERYPKSEYVVDVREKVVMLRDQLAGKEMTVGRFYLERKNYTGAINRFRDVVAKYQTTRHVEEALMRLTEAYFALGITAEAQTAAAVLGHNFPDSPWYNDAHKLLQSGGLEPRENKTSWISRAFDGFRRTLIPG